MRIRTVVICMGILVLGGCETTQTGANALSSQNIEEVMDDYSDRMLEVSFGEVTIKGPFRFHAGYFHQFSNKVLDNWRRSRESSSIFGTTNITGEITLVVRLMDTGTIASVYVIDRSGPMDLELQVRRCMRSTSGIPPWDEDMRKKFGDDLLVQLEFVYHDSIIH